MTAPTDFDVLVAVRDHALGKADALEREAQSCELKARDCRHRATVLRELHATHARLVPGRVETPVPVVVEEVADA